MICDRSVFIIIYFALSIFAPNSSWAAKPDFFSNNKFINNQALLAKDRASNANSSNLLIADQKITAQFKSSRAQLAYSLIQEAKKEKISQNNSANSESSPKTSNFWSLAAMSCTATIALFLIWVLFKKPQGQVALETEISAVTINQQKKIGKMEVKALSQLPQPVQADALIQHGETNQSGIGQLTNKLIVL